MSTIPQSCGKFRILSSFPHSSIFAKTSRICCFISQKIKFPGNRWFSSPRRYFLDNKLCENVRGALQQCLRHLVTIVYGNPIVKAQICTKMRVFSERPALLSVHVDTYKYYMISVSCPCQCWVSNKNNFYRVCEFVKRCQQILLLFFILQSPFWSITRGWMGVEFPEKKHQPSLGCQKINQNEVQNADLREIWDLEILD